MHRRRIGAALGMDLGPKHLQGLMPDLGPAGLSGKKGRMSVHTQAVKRGLDHMEQLHRGSVLVDGRRLSQQRKEENQVYHCWLF